MNDVLDEGEKHQALSFSHLLKKLILMAQDAENFVCSVCTEKKMSKYVVL